MPLVQINSLGFSYGGRDILKDVSLLIDRGTKLALAGANGSGKTTLLRLISARLEPMAGSISREKQARIAYLPQSLELQSTLSLFQEAEKAFDHLAAQEKKLRLLEDLLPDLRGSELEQALEDQHLMQEALNGSSYYLRNREIEQVLLGLGFERGDFTRRCAEFSGGWQMRISLAKILLEGPDLMLLDEPTNYLDIEAREWLADWIRNFPGGLLLVSHDRHFLDQTVEGIAELYLGRLKLYRGNYSKYESTREKELAQILKAWEEQQAEIERIEAFIERFRAKASKAIQVQERIHMLEKMEVIEIPEGLKQIKFHFPAAPRSGDSCLSISGLSKSYPGRPIFRGLELEVKRGEKIALCGKNGAGKSTLLRMIAGQDRNYEGDLAFGTGVIPAYFAQDQDQQLDPGLTVIETVELKANTETYPKLRGLLGAFLFRGDDIYKKVTVLSGGEKNRLALVSMLLVPSNLLILDEPTNHLDLASKKVLQEALSAYQGSIIFVSHDHDFIQALAKRVLEVSPDPFKPEQARRLRNFPGDYDYYRYRIQQEAESGKSIPEQPSPAPGSSAHSGPQDRQKMKEIKALVRRLERQEEEALQAIERREKELEALHHRLSDPQVYSNGDLARNLSLQSQDLEQKIQELLAQWEVLAGELSEARQNLGQD